MTSSVVSVAGANTRARFAAGERQNQYLTKYGRFIRNGTAGSMDPAVSVILINRPNPVNPDSDDLRVSVAESFHMGGIIGANHPEWRD